MRGIRSLAYLLVLVCVIAVLGLACKNADPQLEEFEMASPQVRVDHSFLRVQEYGPLFEEVQMSWVFDDSKTFVDMIPLAPIDSIREAYAKNSKDPAFDLKAFVLANFKMPDMVASDFSTDASLSLDAHIERLWPLLRRDQQNQPTGGTLIPLPYDYTVPGGRFREIYYWDSYFTMLGLLADGREESAVSMLNNFAYLIDQFGFIPNGNRSYYLSRSQPPFFSSMVELLAEAKGDSVWAQYLPAMEAEYAFWMKGSDSVGFAGESHLRCAYIQPGFLVNRYYDNRPRPRPEGFVEDSLLAKASGRDPKELYRDIRAACESGWDFSSRWLVNPMDLGTIRTTEIAPVDLNSLLFAMETNIAKAAEKVGNTTKQKEYAAKAYERRRALISAFWNEEQTWFVDLNIKDATPTGVMTLAGVYPLFFGVATEEQAGQVAEVLESSFLKDGGLITSLNDTGHQWDAPNGWPPLQYMAIAGLRRYGYEDLAAEIASRWIRAGKKVYQQTGKVVEKYNVADTSLLAGGGEYPTQDGFGWSNGVFSQLIQWYPQLN